MILCRRPTTSWAACSQIVGVEIEDAAKWFDLSRLEVKAIPLASLLFTERVAVESSD